MPAALSAILDDDDGLFAGRLVSRRNAARPRLPDPQGVLLSGRERICGCRRRADTAGAGCRAQLRQGAAAVVDGAWLAETDRAGGRPLPGTGRNDGAGGRGRAASARSGLASVL